MAMKIFWSPWAHVMAVTGSCEGGGGERRRERVRKGREREEEGRIKPRGSLTLSPYIQK